MLDVHVIEPKQLNGGFPDARPIEVDLQREREREREVFPTFGLRLQTERLACNIVADAISDAPRAQYTA